MIESFSVKVQSSHYNGVVNNGVIRNENNSLTFTIPISNDDVFENISKSKGDLLSKLTLCFQGESIADDMGTTFQALTLTDIQQYQYHTIDFIDRLSHFIRNDFESNINTTFRSALLEQLLIAIDNIYQYINTLFDTDISTATTLSSTTTTLYSSLKLLNTKNQLSFWLQFSTSINRLLYNIKSYKLVTNNDSMNGIINDILTRFMKDLIAITLYSGETFKLVNVEIIKRFISQFNTTIKLNSKHVNLWNLFDIVFYNELYNQNILFQEYQYLYIKSLNCISTYLVVKNQDVLLKDDHDRSNNSSHWQGVFNLITKYIDWINSNGDNLKERLKLVEQGKFHVDRLLNLLLDMAERWSGSSMPSIKFYLDDDDNDRNNNNNTDNYNSTNNNNNLELFNKLFTIIYDLAFISIDRVDRWIEILDIFLNSISIVNNNNNNQDDSNNIGNHLSISKSIATNIRNRMKESLSIESLPERHQFAQDELMGVSIVNDYRHLYVHAKRLNTVVPSVVLKLYVNSLKITVRHLSGQIDRLTTTTTTTTYNTNALKDEMANSVIKLSKLLDLSKITSTSQQDNEFLIDALFSLLPNIDRFDRTFTKALPRIKDIMSTFKQQQQYNYIISKWCSYFNSISNTSLDEDEDDNSNSINNENRIITLLFNSQYQLDQLVPSNDYSIILQQQEDCQPLLDYLSILISSMLKYNQIQPNQQYHQQYINRFNIIIKEILPCFKKIIIDKDRQYQNIINNNNDIESIIFNLTVDCLYIQYLYWPTLATTLTNLPIPLITTTTSNQKQQQQQQLLQQQDQPKQYYMKLKLYLYYYNRLRNINQFINKYKFDYMTLLPFILLDNEYGSVHRSLIETIMNLLNKEKVFAKQSSIVPLSKNDRYSMLNTFLLNIIEEPVKFKSMLLHTIDYINLFKSLQQIDNEILNEIRWFKGRDTRFAVEFAGSGDGATKETYLFLYDLIPQATIVYSITSRLTNFVKVDVNCESLDNLLSSIGKQLHASHRHHFLRSYCLPMISHVSADLKGCGIQLIYRVMKQFPRDNNNNNDNSNSKAQYFIKEYALLLPKLLGYYKSIVSTVDYVRLLKIFRLFIERLLMYYPLVRCGNNEKRQNEKEMELKLTSPIPTQLMTVIFDRFIPMLVDSIVFILSINGETNNLEQQTRFKHSWMVHSAAFTESITLHLDKLLLIDQQQQSDDINHFKPIDLNHLILRNNLMLMKPLSTNNNNKKPIIKQLFKLLLNLFYFGSYGRSIVLDILPIINTIIKDIQDYQHPIFLYGIEFFKNIGSVGATYIKI
ncbi:hypothetical protein PPL_11775 [Heterostelium album PN500]|uniref:Uncharacterized protein n=1 Tax=Heterostelium pallidum (strain ATCC 26659 / Pp 5 / PN500) TaxID=670386 RepID=D3BUF6_HETP5|nr:hypothetical protein PPL_11775 [Heterostelium album PN500]EFA74744.1 hypothetical protein PPL_11775 [Heterostelium album PN500]|eukprot:XP_020426878.1 hypothetical protein PPL_11775 [Heterostelium album PN500]